MLMYLCNYIQIMRVYCYVNALLFVIGKSPRCDGIDASLVCNIELEDTETETQLIVHPMFFVSICSAYLFI